MIYSVLVNVVSIPLIMGFVLAFLKPGIRSNLLASLVLLFAVVIAISLDGLPAFPPARAIHKLPYIIFAGAIILALSAAVQNVRGRSAAIVSLAVFAATVLAIWWMGKNILMSNSHKASVIAVLLLLGLIGAFTYLRTVSKADSSLPDVLPQAAFATSLATALIAILGGYIGMAMFNGALTALFGGYLLYSFVAYLRGRADAFNVSSPVALAFSWISIFGLLVTALLAPQASAAAILLAALTLSCISVSRCYGRIVSAAPYGVRPLISGGLVAVPALAAIIVAGLQFAG